MHNKQNRDAPLYCIYWAPLRPLPAKHSNFIQNLFSAVGYLIMCAIIQFSYTWVSSWGHATSGNSTLRLVRSGLNLVLPPGKVLKDDFFKMYLFLFFNKEHSFLRESPLRCLVRHHENSIKRHFTIFSLVYERIHFYMYSGWIPTKGLGIMFSKSHL